MAAAVHYYLNQWLRRGIIGLCLAAGGSGAAMALLDENFLWNNKFGRPSRRLALDKLRLEQLLVLQKQEEEFVLRLMDHIDRMRAKS